jgi:hypothetical protein
MSSARVEPDADHDGYGDETQDCLPADATKHDVGCAPTPPAPPAPPLPPPVYIPCPAGGGGCATPGGSGGATPAPAPVKAPAIGPIPPASDPNSVYVSLTCPATVPQHCGGYLILVPGGAHKAAAAPRTRYSIAPGTARKVAIPLTASLRRTLRHDGRLKVTLRLQPDGGTAKTFTRVLTLKHHKQPAKTKHQH